MDRNERNQVGGGAIILPLVSFGVGYCMSEKSYVMMCVSAVLATLYSLNLLLIAFRSP